ncbi:hypothetical protein ACFYYI_08570 [Streptomyces sp. NPDC002387]|uniref:hypothetical protein n=1 Tax=Streptomyces sp. NPDC002387 TaxID=3364643 RepID=UPI0036B6E863
MKGRAEGDTLTLPGHAALTYTRLTAWLSDGLPPVEVAERAGIRVLVFLSPYARCVDGRLPELKQRLEAADDLPEWLGAGCFPSRKPRHVFATATRETPVTAGQPRSILSVTRGVPAASPCPGRGRTRSDQQKGPPGGRALSDAPGRSIYGLALKEGASVRVNWSGDPEVAAWGISMGAALELGLSPEGYTERRDRVITHALLVGPELARDPYTSEPVIRWSDVRHRAPNSGAWPVKAEQVRPRWDWTPLEGIGPLRFGMNSEQVAAVLNEVPAARHGRYPFGQPWEGFGTWMLHHDRFDATGVTAHYTSGFGAPPTLGAVTVHGRTGPQIDFEGIRLIGMAVSAVDTALIKYIEEREMGLVVGCSGDLGPDGLNMYVRATRAGDTVVSEARFCQEGWEDHG